MRDVMGLQPFAYHFPEVAKKEIRSIHLSGKPVHGSQLPPGEYALFESYCTDSTCDCRRVMLNVCTEAGEVAAISYGFDRNGPMPGPFLDPINPQSRHAEEILQMVTVLVLNDPEYLA